jgi:hypothetical protein
MPCLVWFSLCVREPRIPLATAVKSLVTAKVAKNSAKRAKPVIVSTTRQDNTVRTTPTLKETFLPDYLALDSRT